MKKRAIAIMILLGVWIFCSQTIKDFTSAEMIGCGIMMYLFVEMIKASADEDIA